MITISGLGNLRNNKLEFVRALEVAQIMIHMFPYSYDHWTLYYGELPLGAYRVDSIMDILQKDKRKQRIGVEIVSKNEDIQNANSKLYDLIRLGEIDCGYIYIRTLEDVYNEMVKRSMTLKMIKGE